MKRVMSVLLIVAPLLIVSCSNDTPKTEHNNKKEMGVIEKKQHEIAQDAVKGMKAPVDKARAVSAGEDERNKDLKKASEN